MGRLRCKMSDVCWVLTEGKDPQAYWRKLKQLLREEGNETVTNCHALNARGKGQ